MLFKTIIFNGSTHFYDFDFFYFLQSHQTRWIYFFQTFAGIYIYCFTAMLIKLIAFISSFSLVAIPNNFSTSVSTIVTLAFCRIFSICFHTKYMLIYWYLFTVPLKGSLVKLTVYRSKLLGHSLGFFLVRASLTVIVPHLHIIRGISTITVTSDGHHSLWNHQQHDCLLNSVLSLITKYISTKFTPHYWPFALGNYQ